MAEKVKYPINIKLTVEQENTIKSMASMCYNSGGKTYWFMPVIFEETNNPLEYMVHELPERFSRQFIDFLNA